MSSFDFPTEGSATDEQLANGLRYLKKRLDAYRSENGVVDVKVSSGTSSIQQRQDFGSPFKNLPRVVTAITSFDVSELNLSTEDQAPGHETSKPVGTFGEHWHDVKPHKHELSMPALNISVTINSIDESGFEYSVSVGADVRDVSVQVSWLALPSEI